MTADLLSRWTNSPADNAKLKDLVPGCVWIPTHLDLTLLNYDIYVSHSFLIFVEFPPQASQLVTLASNRLLGGFRPTTKRQYARMWLDFQPFKVATRLLHHQVDVFIILSFMEYLFQNIQSHNNMANYMAALRAYHILHGLNTKPFRDECLALYLKSLRIQAPLAPSRRSLVDVQLLTKIIQTCDLFTFSVIFNPLYLLCFFFSFLCLSSIFPHSVATFDHTRQLTRADYIFIADGAVLLIKWSKTLQNRMDIVTIPIPLLGNTPLCPIVALNRMIQLYPVSDNEPLFVVPIAQGLVPQGLVLTDSVARKHLKDISLHLGLSKMLTFHDFSQAGASWAFQNGVPLEHIMKHATWKSDAIWTYLSSSPILLYIPSFILGDWVSSLQIKNHILI